MTPTTPTIASAPRRRLIAGAGLFGLSLFACAVAQAESEPRYVPTASAYFLNAAGPMPETGAPAPESETSPAWPRVGLPDDPNLSAGGCESPAADNPFCELRWTTGRSRGSDIRARYYEMTDDVKTRLVGKSRAEYFDLDLDSSPEFRFKLRF